MDAKKAAILVHHKALKGRAKLGVPSNMKIEKESITPRASFYIDVNFTSKGVRASFKK